MNMASKRFLAMLLALVLLVSQLGGPALAAQSEAQDDTAVEATADTAEQTTEESVVSGVTVEPLSIMEGTCGYQESEFYYYYWEDYVSFTVYFTDGSSYTGTGTYYEYQGNGYGASWSSDQWGNHWEAGNTYEATLSFLDYAVTVPVTITESPVVSVEVAPISIIEGTCGYQESEFYYYHWQNYISFTVYFTDGSSYTGTGTYFEYQGNGYWANYSSDQWDNHWEAGNTYEATLYFSDYEVTVPVTITESPVVSVEVAPISIIEGTCGYHTGEFYYYWWQNYVSFTVYFTDGSSYTGTGTYFEHQGSGYWADYSSDQWDNHWEAGNTYEATLYFLDYEVTVPVTITESPVVSVEVEPLSIMEGTNGGYNGEYYYYHWQNSLSYTLYFADGSSYTGNGTYFEYQGNSYRINYSSDQDENHWDGGNTYSGTVWFLGYEVTVPVTITESPVVSVEVAPISIIEGTCGYHNGSFYYYQWNNKLSFTVYFSDGSSYTGDSTYFQYQGNAYWADCCDDQWGENWQLGNTYEVTTNFMGYEVTVPVSIIECPVVSIEPAHIYLVENQGGSDYGSYYHYWWSGELCTTVTFNDGTQLEVSGTSFTYDGQDYSISYSDTQDSVHFLAGNTYEAEITLADITATVYITVQAPVTANGFTYITQDGAAIIYGYTGTEQVVSIPETIGGLPVTGVANLGEANITELILPDSVTMLSSYTLVQLYALEKLTIGAGITDFDINVMPYLRNLSGLYVSPDNPSYTGIDGAVYDKDCTTLLMYPKKKSDTHIVPDSVTNIDIIFDTEVHAEGISVVPGANTQGDFCYEDGVYYSTDKTQVLLCDCNKTGSYVMPETVDTINYYAFSGGSLEEVTVSSAVTQITYCAFYNSQELQKIDLPENLESIGYRAFCGTTELTQVTLPESVTSIGDRAFYESGLKEVTLTSAMKELGYAAFAHSALEQVTLSEGLTNLSSYIFSSTQLKTVTIPDSLVSLDYGAFAYCDDLASVSIGSGLTKIEDNTFYSTGLTSVTLPENIQYVGNRAFANSALTEVHFENDAIVISYAAFANCPLAEVVLGENVTDVYDSAFLGTAVESITLPESLTSISYRCFAYSENLSYIDVSNSLEYLDGMAFEGTAWLNAQPEGPVYLENYFYTYKGQMPMGTTLELEEGTALIASYAMQHQYGLTELKLPASLHGIGESALYLCFNLENIEIAEGNTVFTYEDGILYQNGSAIWSRPMLTELRYYGPSTIPYGQALDTSRMYLYFESQTGSYGYPLNRIDAELSGFDPYTPGVQTVTVTIGGQSASCEVTVEEVLMLDVTVDDQVLGVQTAASVACGGSYTFTPTQGYCALSAAMGGSEVEIADNGDGSFTVSNITSDLIVTVQGHSWGSWITLLDESCTCDGVKAHMCTVCNYAVSEAIPAPGHSYESTTVAPTCEEDGYTVHVCSVCGDTQYTDFVAAKGHVWSIWFQLVAPTCTAEGQQARFCNCGTKEYSSLPMLAHTYEAGSCTACGKEEAEVYFESSALTLGGILELDVKIYSSDTSGAYTLQATAGDETTAYTDYAISGDYITFTVLVPAHLLSAPIDLQVYRDGCLAASQTWTMEAYADGIRESSADDEQLLTLVDALEQYGLYAAYYADPTGEAPADEAVDAVSASQLAAYACAVTVKNSTGLKPSATVYLDDACSLRFKFDADAWGDNTLYINGSAVAVSEANGKIVYELPELLPQDWDTLYNVRVVDGSGNVVFEMQYSVLSYVQACLGRSTELKEGLNGLLRSMYLYYTAAKACAA